MMGAERDFRTAVLRVVPQGSEPEPWYGLGRADIVFIGLTIAALLRGAMGIGMVDDPGLGWHLRIADLIWERGEFPYWEEFCFPTESKPWVVQAWLGDILLRLAYGWGGLNGIAVLTALTIALTLRCLYTRIIARGVPSVIAGPWVVMAAAGTLPAWTARPNIFTFLGLVLVADICERFNRDLITRRQTLWLLLIFVLWPNMHGGFLAGLIVLGLTYSVEFLLATLSGDTLVRRMARRRFAWWTMLLPVILGCTLLNPYGFGLHLWNFQVVTDVDTLRRSTTEWLPPDFTAPGWQGVEAGVLLLPLLAMLSRYRPRLLAVVLCIAWLHFALSSLRYAPLYILVATPTLAELSCRIPYLQQLSRRLLARLSSTTATSLVTVPRRFSFLFSLVFAAGLLLVSPGLGPIVTHQLIPARSLDRFLSIYEGERVFHDANWGGYLIWHGWDLEPRFQAWIDDRNDVHGAEHLAEYRSVMAAEPGWQQVLETHDVHLLCLPPKARLAEEAKTSSEWLEVFHEEDVIVFRRQTPSSSSGHADK